MWTDNDFTRGSGGFDASSYANSPTTNTNEAKQSKKPTSVFPVAIKQIINDTEESLTIHGYPVSMLTIVGIIRNIEYTSTKIVYTIQDWSGTITGMLWIESDKSDQKSTGVIENTYCRVSGTRRIQDGKACLFVYDVNPITDMNELTYHYLQVIHIGLKVEELKQEPVITQSSNANSYQTARDFLVPDVGLTPHQKQVYLVIQACSSDSGIHRREVISSLKSHLSATDVENALQFLNGEGHVYCTLDDDHFKVT